MPPDRITELRVQGVRTLADVTLELRGLTVLIGDNGSGKSSLIEACELLRRAAGAAFFEELNTIHGGARSFVRWGSPRVGLGVTIEGAGPRLLYDLVLRIENGRFEVESETLSEAEAGTAPVVVLSRRGDTIDLPGGGKGPPTHSLPPALALYGPLATAPALSRAFQAVRGIDVHLPFNVTARWALRASGSQPSIRDSVMLEPVDAVSRFGANLPNAYQELRNTSEGHWRETLAYVRLGLGQELESVNVRPDPGGGSLALRLKYAGVDEQVPAIAISDGQLAYLAFVALHRLNAKKSLLAFDEPETHLHPELLMRVLGFFEIQARDRSVLLATHSDRLLDGLTDPGSSVALVELDASRRTRILRPDRAVLASWLERYRGLGDVRAESGTPFVFTKEQAE